jgi:hypothetical protein
MIEDFKNVWKEGPGDPLDYVGSKPAAPHAAKPVRAKNENFLYEDMGILLWASTPPALSGYAFSSYGVCARKNTLCWVMSG